jgi:tyrosyl-tRNA synthetase
MEIDKIKDLCQKDIREAKKLLAFEVTKLVHGEEEANKAKKIAEELFAGIGVSDNMPFTNISKEKLGINVIAIGVPTVVDAATMANDTIELMLENISKMGSQNGINYDKINEMEQTEKYNTIPLKIPIQTTPFFIA